MALFRPSELARLWAIHPKTVNQWIREGRLPAIKTPGAQYRIRSEEARAYCEANGLPMPRALRSPQGAVIALGKASPTQRALGRACRARGTTFAPFSQCLDGLLAAAADPPEVLAIDAGCTDFKLAEAVRALRRLAKAAQVGVLIYDVAVKAPKPAGLPATDDVRFVLRSSPSEAVRSLIDLLEPRPLA